MKNRFFTYLRPLPLAGLLMTGALLTTACLKDDPTTTVSPVSPAVDEAIIQKYIADKGITGAQRQSSGLYFVPVTTDASAVRATAGKMVSVLYTGQLLNGTVFDASSQHGGSPFNFRLGQQQVIAGWDEGIALMHKGDKAILLIPSAMGYGVQDRSPSIPPNSVLRFDVELTNVQ